MLLRKVVDDARRAPLRAHCDLAETLLNRLAAADARARQGLGFCVSSLLPALPRETQQQLHSALLTSQFVGVRRRGYKAINEGNYPEIGVLLSAWGAFSDPECAWLLVKRLPPRQLLACKEEFLPSLSEGWKLSRLFLRIAEVNPNAVDELARLDAISYCYVLAKLGRRLSASRARSLLKRYELDERLGLLVWSIGQMGLWGVLKWLSAQMPSMQRLRASASLATDGVPLRLDDSKAAPRASAMGG